MNRSRATANDEPQRRLSTRIRRDSLGRLSSVRQTERYDSRIVDIQSQSWHQVISGIEKERSPRTRM